MKTIFQVLFLLCFFSVNAQDTIIGEYYDNSGSELKLKPDSTFNYTYKCDMTSSWTNGRYKIKKHTIYLEFIPVYNTLRYDKNDAKYKPDSLVLSSNEIPKVISYEKYAFSQIGSGGQNMMGYPEKLYYEKGKLYKFSYLSEQMDNFDIGCYTGYIISIIPN